MSLTWRRSRITGAGLVAAQYDLTLERQTTMDNILFIPGIANPVSEIRQLLFGQGQPGGSWTPTLSSAMIAANTFGSGVTDILDLSGRNNPFSQATPASRGAWFREPKRGRVNLLERTEEFDNTGFWSTAISGGGISATITPNAGIDPFGGLTADRLVASKTGSSTGDLAHVRNTGSLTSSYTGQVTMSVWLRSNTGVNQNVWAMGIGSSPNVVTVTPVWNLFTFTLSVTANNLSLVFNIGARGNSDNEIDILMSRAQLELGSTATAYQRVTTAFDVTEAGQRDCYGVRGDGIDDGYATAGNVDFTGTNRVTVFAALRKRSDATRGIFFEHTTNTGNNSGGFVVNAPSGALNDYGFFSASTSGNIVITFGSTNPPVAVVTGQASILEDILTIRLNGTQVGSSSADQGSGTYANAVMHLFRRGGTTFPFNGDLYALIVAGGSYPLSTIQRVERILSRITPTVNL
jgi:hypothetical protein